MTDGEVAILTRALIESEQVLWQPHDTAPALRISHIGIDPKKKSGAYEPEPGLLAFFHAPHGQYVNLGNCELRDFLAAKRL